MAFPGEIIPAIPMSCWNYNSGGQMHLTGHTHYMSPYESDDDCGTCDGAKCEWCREYVESERIELSIPSDIYEMLRARFGDFAYPDMYDLQNFSEDYYKAVLAYLDCEDPMRVTSSNTKEEKEKEETTEEITREEKKERLKARLENVILAGFKPKRMDQITSIKGDLDIYLHYTNEEGDIMIPVYITKDMEGKIAADYADNIISIKGGEVASYRKFYRDGYYYIPLNGDEVQLFKDLDMYLIN